MAKKKFVSAKRHHSSNLGCGRSALSQGAERDSEPSLGSPGATRRSRGSRGEAPLKVAYRKFVEEVEPERKDLAGRDLIRAIFGNDSVAEYPVFRSAPPS